MSSGTENKTSIAAIPTVYAGVRFRSRLEAKWAAFFDTAGWGWSYEPYDLSGWVPDFALRFKRPVLVEVKPALSLAELLPHYDKIERARPFYEVLLVGADVGLVPDRWHGSTSLGCLLEHCEDGPGWGVAAAFECSCGPSFAHDVLDYSCRVCGQGRVDRADGYAWPLQAMRNAQNTTQWGPR